MKSYVESRSSIIKRIEPALLSTDFFLLTQLKIYLNQYDNLISITATFCFNFTEAGSVI